MNLGRRTYVWRDGRMVCKATGEPMLSDAERAVLTVPQVVPDTPGYQSPIDGNWIEGRRARRYDLESNNCVEVGDRAPLNGGRLKNKRFAKKRGLEHLLEQ